MIASLTPRERARVFQSIFADLIDSAASGQRGAQASRWEDLKRAMDDCHLFYDIGCVRGQPSSLDDEGTNPSFRNKPYDNSTGASRNVQSIGGSP